MKTLTYLFPLLFLVLSSCGNDDDPIIENEEEIITDVVYVLTGVDTASTVTMRFSDSDGDGPAQATTEVTGTLLPNTRYSGAISLSNLSNPSDPEDVNAEIAAEDEDHQFFYVVSGGLNATVSYVDLDDDGNPLGLLTEVETGAASSGSFQVILRHEPDKSAGATIGDPSAAGGETDLSVTFAVSVGN